MRLPTFAAAALLLLPVAAELPAQRTITKSDVRTAPPAETHGRLRDQVWQMFQREDRRSERAPRRPLDEVWLTTRPRGTDVPGLCRFDLAVVEFAPVARVGEDGGNADTPVRAVGISASPRYRFSSPPAGFHRRISDPRRLPQEGGCETLDTDRDGFFEAPDEETATDGVLAFSRLLDALRAGRDVPLQCALHPDETDCRAVILAHDAASIDRVETCRPSGGGRPCFLVSAYDREIEVELEPDLQAAIVHSARLVSMIVMSHSRID
ncbi:MAG TPA: hypothetical protein VF552_12325 [Allosphingosinicella sp.]|jgi:hypothetical protein